MGCTAFEVSAENGDLAVMQLLLDRGAEANASEDVSIHHRHPDGPIRLIEWFILK